MSAQFSVYMLTRMPPQRTQKKHIGAAARSAEALNASRRDASGVEGALDGE